LPESQKLAASSTSEEGEKEKEVAEITKLNESMLKTQSNTQITSLIQQKVVFPPFHTRFGLFTPQRIKGKVSNLVRTSKVYIRVVSNGPSSSIFSQNALEFPVICLIP
jgi:hypothetical protein